MAGVEENVNEKWQKAKLTDNDEYDPQNNLTLKTYTCYWVFGFLGIQNYISGL